MLSIHSHKAVLADFAYFSACSACASLADCRNEFPCAHTPCRHMRVYGDARSNPVSGDFTWPVFESTKKLHVWDKLVCFNPPKASKKQRHA